MNLPDTRHSLLSRLKDSSDCAAWMEFCAIYEPTSYRIARKYGLQDADAREVSQEVLLSVSRKIGGFNFNRDGRFRAWLATIARNATIDQLRRKRSLGSGSSSIYRRLAQVPDRSETLQQADLAFDIEARRQQFRWAAEQVRQSVGATTWQAFWLTAVEGQSTESVAQTLGISLGAIYVARCRTLAKIKAILEPFREEAP